MTFQPLLRLGPVRRFTRNLLRPVDLLGRPLLLKYTRDPAEAREEIRGHARLSRHYRVPALDAHLRVPGGHLRVRTPPRRHRPGTPARPPQRGRTEQ
ncbi:hypothetical protein O1L60_29105 [Streptomyces diastatochromogenes]|nr:hypothetical protein [Streptomyces diastatochromogenes]